MGDVFERIAAGEGIKMKQPDYQNATPEKLARALLHQRNRKSKKSRGKRSTSDQTPDTAGRGGLQAPPKR